MKTITFTYETDDGEEVEAVLPARMEVCTSCHGEGAHVNRNIDGNGITSSEWAEWDEEDRETYMSGGYDVTCEECGGRNVVAVVDEENADKELLVIYFERQAATARDNYEDAYTRRMEGGY